MLIYRYAGAIFWGHITDFEESRPGRDETRRHSHVTTNPPGEHHTYTVTFARTIYSSCAKSNLE